MWYVYILNSVHYKWRYVGITNDLKKRFSKHNKKQIYSTKERAPFVLLYYEAHHNKKDAAAREKFLKTGWGKLWIERTMKHYFTELKS